MDNYSVYDIKHLFDYKKVGYNVRLKLNDLSSTKQKAVHKFERVGILEDINGCMVLTQKGERLINMILQLANDFENT